jgi:hypothetical protein
LYIDYTDQDRIEQLKSELYKYGWPVKKRLIEPGCAVIPEVSEIDDVLEYYNNLAKYIDSKVFEAIDKCVTLKLQITYDSVYAMLPRLFSQQLLYTVLSKHLVANTDTSVGQSILCLYKNVGTVLMSVITKISKYTEVVQDQDAVFVRQRIIEDYIGESVAEQNKYTFVPEQPKTDQYNIIITGKRTGYKTLQSLLVSTGNTRNPKGTCGPPKGGCLYIITDTPPSGVSIVSTISISLVLNLYIATFG